MEEIAQRTKNLIYCFRVSFEYEGEKDTYHLNYENGTYRQNELIALIRDSVIYFALTSQEINQLVEDREYSEMYRRAWTRISKAHKNKKGDYGELILFLLLNVFYPTEKFVTKVRLRSSIKEQVKGFDCAHFSVENGRAVLWLGEAKFHQSFSTAITQALASIEEHANHDYLNEEISILTPNLEINDTERLELLKNELSRGKSIDDLKLIFPILLTYDCKVISNHNTITEDFQNDLEEDIQKKIEKIDQDNTLDLKENIELRFILLPFESVKDLKDKLEKIEETYHEY